MAIILRILAFLGFGCILLLALTFFGVISFTEKCPTWLQKMNKVRAVTIVSNNNKKPSSPTKK